MFWRNVLVLNLMIPIIMLIIGILHLMKPPKDRNWLYGYCTRRSTKSRETWRYAQRLFGSVCCGGGVCSILLALWMMLSVLSKDIETIRTTGSVLGMLETIMMIGAFVVTENTLKRKFDM